MTLTDQEKRMMQRMENSISATPTQAQIEAAVGRKFATFGGGVGSDYNPIAEALKDKPLTFAAGVSVAEVVEFVLTAAAKVVATEVEALEEHQAMLRAHAEIEAATIERCAQVADSFGFDIAMTTVATAAVRIAAAIRALKDKP